MGKNSRNFANFLVVRESYFRGHLRNIYEKKTWKQNSHDCKISQNLLRRLIPANVSNRESVDLEDTRDSAPLLVKP